jgi:hypothetical protein
MKQLLELFKGTGSVGKVALKNGYNVLSVDIERKYDPDIHIDILDWDYKKFYNETGYVPDFIWASPPCNTFSQMVYRLYERNTKTAEPYSSRAKNGTKILYTTLNIIKFFLKKNPEMIFVIENPRGMMRHDKRIKKLVLNNTNYCEYGDCRTKSTDFFSNIPLYLNEPKCKGTCLVARLPLDDRYKIPPKLIQHIFNVANQTTFDIFDGKY